MTDPLQWPSAKRLFDEALDLDPAERDAFLRRECDGAPDLLAEVQSLLRWHDDSVPFLETPVARLADVPSVLDAADAPIGQSLGPWHIVDVIGRGGMGVVYRAERADAAFSRQAAIKVVRSGVQSAAIVDRFKRERDTLAALDHPRIARLLDGGTTPDGQPYLVMEFVEGVRVDEYCDTQRLTLADRLVMFRAICGGVQYAHENLVVHRDIKPDNILVAKDGRPKLLDFGVSKILSGVAPRDDEPAMKTTWLMTPDFASPEQISGGPITTASDVYSLGVLLYVLATGAGPYRLTGTTPAAVRTELAKAEWTPPSARALGGDAAVDRAAARATTPRALSASLSGDLDAIIGKALSRDVATRYATVAHLVDELERYQTSQPVIARRPERGYVTRTFIRRNRAALTVAAGVVLLTAAGVAGVLWQSAAAARARGDAERRFEDVRQLAHAFLFDVNDAIVDVPGATAARTLIVRTSVAYLDRLAHESANDRGLQRELASAYVRVGDAQGNPAGPNLGDTTGALASYRHAIAIGEGVRAAAPDDVEITRTLALAHRRLGDVLGWTGDLQAALSHATGSGALFARVAALPGATVEDRVQSGVAQIKLGDLLGNQNFPNLGRAADAAARYDDALGHFRRLDAAGPAHPRVKRYLGLTLERIGTLHEYARRLPEASAAYRESFEIRRALAAVEPAPAEAQRDYAIASEKLGNVELLSGQAAAAAEHYRQALAQFERLGQADPSNANASRTIAISREKLAGVEDQLGRAEAAAGLLRSAVSVHRDLAGRDSANAQARCDVARVAELYGDLIARHRSLATGTLRQAGCDGWRESLATRTGLSAAGNATCARPEDAARLKDKLKSCR